MHINCPQKGSYKRLPFFISKYASYKEMNEYVLKYEYHVSTSSVALTKYLCTTWSDLNIIHRNEDTFLLIC